MIIAEAIIYILTILFLYYGIKLCNETKEGGISLLIIGGILLSISIFILNENNIKNIITILLNKLI